MHGRHHTGWVKTVVRESGFGIRDSGFGVPGEVACSFVGPNIAVTGMPIAAARCIAPESFVTSARQFASTPASAERSVRPTRLTMEHDALVDRSTDVPVPASAAVPTITHCTPSAAKPLTSSAKYSGGQRFAP